jgi:hypothetical protein
MESCQPIQRLKDKRKKCRFLSLCQQMPPAVIAEFVNKADFSIGHPFRQLPYRPSHSTSGMMEMLDDEISGGYI